MKVEFESINAPSETIDKITDKEYIFKNYMTMSAKEISANRVLVDSCFSGRTPSCISSFFDIPEYYILNNWMWSKYQDGLTKAQNYFGVKDHLEPLEEYAARIKKSSKYKKFVSTIR